MTKTQHKRTAVASMLQNGISQNTKCAERASFRREGHIYSLFRSTVLDHNAMATHAEFLACLIMPSSKVELIAVCRHSCILTFFYYV